METIQVKDLTFKPFITADVLEASIAAVADKINQDYAGKEVLFVGVLNGVFMFASDLFKHITMPCQISFVKVSSYSGTESTGTIKHIFGLNEEVKGKHIILLEDIVDTGITIESIYNDFLTYQPASLEICTLLFKKEKYEKQIPLKYICFSIPNSFVLGYGLDYDGYARNLPEIYQLCPKNA
jgi:hypoxanthine phosphoribosyltransferase